MTRRKLSILTLVLCILLVVSLVCGCNLLPSNNSASEHKLMVQDPNGYLIEDLQESYKAGDEVTVKTTMLSDVVLRAYLDGVSLGLETPVSEEGEYHCEFYFEMPSHDAVLSFSTLHRWTHEGIPLDAATQQEIINAFVNVHSQDRYPVTEDEISLRCFGAFDGVYVLFVDVASWVYTAAIKVDVIAGVKFIYSSGQTMYVYCDDAFYSISEAYEKNILSYENLVATQQNYRTHSEMLYDENDLPEGLTRNGIPLDKATQTEIKTAFYNTYKDKYPNLGYEHLSLRCYGAFDGVYVIFEDGIWDCIDVVTSEIIADVIFVYPNGLHMTVYCDGAFYTLSEAYENGILSYENLLMTQLTYKACHGSLYSEDHIHPQPAELW